MKKIDLNKYDYGLTKEKIAQFPLEDRTKSKLLVAKVKDKSIEHRIFYEFPKLISNNSHLFINTTKVIPARLNFRKQTGGKAELLLLEPIKPSQKYEITMKAEPPVVWKCIVGGRNIKINDVLQFENSLTKDIKNIKAKIVEIEKKEAIVEIVWEPKDISFAIALDCLGKTPLPPYISREPIEKDRKSYQTIYAKHNGSVAAPTAGLHFTDELLSEIEVKGIPISEIILHVGASTFLPIENDDVENHNMHSEVFTVSYDTISKLLSSLESKKNIIATGTTTLRTLESLYWLGAKLSHGFKLSDDNFIQQNEPSILANDTISPTSALNLLLETMQKDDIYKIHGRTQLFIVPGYRFKIINSLITNFHVPKSTLILLIAAFLGEDFWRKVYQEAIDKDYRFLSYGDATFLENY